MGTFAQSFSQGIGIGQQMVDLFRKTKAAAYDQAFLDQQLQQQQLQNQSLDQQNQQRQYSFGEYQDQQSNRDALANQQVQSGQQGLLQGQQNYQTGQMHQQQMTQDMTAQNQQMQQAAQMFPLHKDALVSQLATSKLDLKRAELGYDTDQQTQAGAVAGMNAKNDETVGTWQWQKKMQNAQEEGQKTLEPYMTDVLKKHGLKPNAANFMANFAAGQQIQQIDHANQEVELKQQDIQYKTNALALGYAQLGVKSKTQFQQTIQQLAGPNGWKAASYMAQSPDDPQGQAVSQYFLHNVYGQLGPDATEDQIKNYLLQKLVDKSTPDDDRAKAASIMGALAGASGDIKTGKVQGPSIVKGFPGPMVDETPEQAQKRTVDNLSKIPGMVEKPAAPQQQQAPTQTGQPQAAGKVYNHTDVVDAVKSGTLKAGTMIKLAGQSQPVLIDQAYVDSIKKSGN